MGDGGGEMGKASGGGGGGGGDGRSASTLSELRLRRRDWPLGRERSSGSVNPSKTLTEAGDQVGFGSLHRNRYRY
jgi:hypothetical protein